MRNWNIYIGLVFSVFLLSFSFNKIGETVTISEAKEGNSAYALKCNKQLNETNKVTYQYFLEIYSNQNPRSNFDSDDDYAAYTQFHLQELFSVKMKGIVKKVYGARMEQGIKGSNIYRITLYFEDDTFRKIKNLEIDFDDKLFENKKIILTAKKVKL